MHLDDSWIVIFSTDRVYGELTLAMKSSLGETHTQQHVYVKYHPFLPLALVGIDKRISGPRDGRFPQHFYYHRADCALNAYIMCLSTLLSFRRCSYRGDIGTFAFETALLLA